MSLKAAVILPLAVFLYGTIAAQRAKKSAATKTDTTFRVIHEVPSIGGVPLIIDSSSLDAADLPPVKSPRAFDLAANDKRTPLPYENLRWDDALYVQKVWRELDFKEKINLPFLYDANGANSSQLFINILLRAVRNGTVQAFADDRFTTPVSSATINDLVAGKLDTVPRINPGTGITDAWIVTRESFDVKSVNKLLMMEEWIFDRESSRMFCRIIGIAPLKTRYIPVAGSKPVESSSIMFWLNYPDLRTVLANELVYNSKNTGPNQMTWEELFESRMFGSHIVKATLNNPSNQAISAYIKDPVLALREGDNIQQKIFNYEQDLWSY